jgi:hypothetical protein
MLLAIAVLISVGLAFFVAAPLLLTESAGAGTLPIDVTPLGDLQRRRLVVYENLKDLEFEFQAGKIARDDYETLRENYLGEAAQLMLASQDEEAVSSDSELIERLVTARRVERQLASHHEYICPKCGFENPLPVKFCGECGARIKTRKGR